MTGRQNWSSGVGWLAHVYGSFVVRLWYALNLYLPMREVKIMDSYKYEMVTLASCNKDQC
jgi:hypothetical protein